MGIPISAASHSESAISVDRPQIKPAMNAMIEVMIAAPNETLSKVGNSMHTGRSELNYTHEGSTSWQAC